MDDRRLDEILRAQLDRTLEATSLDFLGEKYEGKVRDCYIDRAGGERVIVVTDRLSAFDRVLDHDPVQGPGPQPDRPVLVRGDPRTSRPTTWSRCPTPT